jgi:anti-sigma-K factor RskA
MSAMLTPEERDQLAAEFALGVLDGAELRDARALAMSDAQFREAVGRWSGRLAPLLDDVELAAPPEGLWSKIEQRLASDVAGSNVIALRRRVNLWRGATAALTAIAASLALVLVTRPPERVEVPVPVPAQQQASAPMVATLGDKGTTKMVASWNPGDRMLVVAASADMPVDNAHAHELWVIPAGGKPMSLGTMPGGRHMAMEVPEQLSSKLVDGATLAVSVEPAGGSKTGAPTGPVVASGALENA